MLHFGEAPRWAENVRFIVIDRDASLSFDGLKCAPPQHIVADCKAFIEAFANKIEQNHFSIPNDSEWISALRTKKEANEKRSAATAAKETHPLNFSCSMKCIADVIEEFKSLKICVASEGANTMDFSRQFIPVHTPRYG